MGHHRSSRLIFVLSLHVLSATPAFSTSPTVDEACRTSFFKWFKDQVYNLEKPEKVDHLAIAAKTCLQSLPAQQQPAAQKCMAPVVGLAKAYKNSLLTVMPEAPQKNVRPLVLPKALRDVSVLRELTFAGEIPEGEKDKVPGVLENLGRILPKSARVFEFYSHHVNARTFVIALPSPKEDIYLHTNAKPGDFADFHYLAIRVNKMGQGGKKLDPPTTDFFTFTSEDGEKPLGASEQDKTGRCISCHRSGSVAILPKAGSPFISHTKGISGEEMKKWWNDFRVKNMDRSEISYEHLGPPIGPSPLVTPGRTDQFVKTCSENEIRRISAESIQKVKENMDCAGCHGYGNRLETLRVPTHATFNGNELKILEHIVLSGHMPLGSSDPKNPGFLNLAERKALFACLKAEYFGGFKNQEFSKGNSKPGLLMNHLLSGDCNPPATNGAKGGTRTGTP